MWGGSNGLEVAREHPPPPHSLNPHSPLLRPRDGGRPVNSHTREEWGFCNCKEVKGAFTEEREYKELA